jgi:hypothetical protein
MCNLQKQAKIRYEGGNKKFEIPHFERNVNNTLSKKGFIL